MFARRALLVIPLVATTVMGCRLLRPMNPNADASGEAPELMEAGPAPDTGMAPMVQAEPRPVGRVTDATIAAMVLAANNVDISYARLVAGRSERADVLQFADRMRTDHAVVNNLVHELATRLEIAPEDNTASLDLRDESAVKREMLRDLRGFAFDSAYATNEISYHRRYLESVDLVMLPNVRNDDMRAMLTNVRPIIAAHLAHAEQLWANVMTRK